MQLKYNEQGLIPVIVQDYLSKDVLMLAYMNEEAFNKTIETKQATYFSRSRKTLWVKGETSENTQKVKGFSYDCDEDTLLLQVEQTGAACHTNNYSCFYRDIIEKEDANNFILEELFTLLKERKLQMPEGSYTTYLYEKGIDKILKKVAEETGETIIAAKNNNEELIYEISDLIYHLFVLMVDRKVELNDILQELSSRRK